MARNLSYRYKVPLSFGAIILVTGIIMSTSLLYRSARNLEQDIIINSQQLGEVMVSSLGPFIQHDAVWDAYQLIRTPKKYTDNMPLQPKTILVVDAGGSIFVSTDSDRFPLTANLKALGEEYRILNDKIVASPASNIVFKYDKGAHLVIAIPVQVGDSVVGHLVIVYDSSLFAQRFILQAAEAGMITIAILGLLLPVGWLFGNQVARPLVKLASCMSEVGKMTPDEMDCKLAKGNDEIGRLGQQFREMLHDLEYKRELEKSVVVSDRLAALGRLVASIAHEINNPLAGMLNAVDTYRKHGSNDPLATRTINLLERGLEQIRNTVSALVVEARISTLPLSPHDIEDILTLVTPEIRKKNLQLSWDSDLDTSIPLPSSLVRQVLLNLTLNAVKASPDGGTLNCRIKTNGEGLRISMVNESEHIPTGQLERLFEPFASFNESGTGLGLWVTYQIVEQLGGEITITAPQRHVVVEVNLPVQEAA